MSFETDDDEGSEDVELGGGMLQTAESVREYILAGRATVTLRSQATRKRFTYKVTLKPASDLGAAKYFVSVLSRPDTYSRLGWFTAEPSIGDLLQTVRGGLGCETPAFKAFAWFWFKLHNDATCALAQTEVWHKGHCGRCGRELTVPESIASGIGPECAAKMRMQAELANW